MRACGATRYDETQNSCTRDVGHKGAHRCKAADVDARARGEATDGGTSTMSTVRTVQTLSGRAFVSPLSCGCRGVTTSARDTEPPHIGIQFCPIHGGGPDMLGALELALATIELHTGRGCQNAAVLLKDGNGNVDYEATAREIRAAVRAVTKGGQ